MRKFILLVAVILLSNQSLFSQVPSYVPSNGLVGFWLFSGNANDSSVNGNVGTVNGATLTTDRNGVANSAYSFNGSSSYISVPNNATFNFQNKFTFSYWINPNSLSVNELSVILSKQVNYGPDQNGFNSSVEVGSYSNFRVQNGTSNPAFSLSTPNNSILINNWYHVVHVWTGTQGYIYINGLLVSQGTTTATVGNTTAELLIGKPNWSAGNVKVFNGKIDDVGIWNRALTAQEISSIYYQTTSTTCLPDYVPTNGLVGYWPFCGNANDASTNGNNGTVNGASLTTDRNGVANSAYSFNGNSGISIPHSTSLNIASSSTFSFWLKYNSLSNGFNLVFKKGIVGGCPNSGYYFAYDGIPGPAYKCFGYGVPGNCSGISDSSYLDNQWHNIVVVYNLQNSQIYFDGILQDGDANNNINQPIFNTSEPLVIGYYNGPYSGNSWNGLIDDIGIWNRALTAQEIANLYTSCVSPAAPTGALTQTFCVSPAPTIASLSATGTGIQWYAAASGGTALASTTALVNGTTYYASQTVSACESSSRLAVTVTLNDPQITASATTVCIGTPVNLSASTTATTAQNCNLPVNLQTGLVGYWPFCGNANDVSGNANNGTVNGATLTTDRFGNVNSAYSFDGVSNYIKIETQTSNNQSSNYTWSFWFKSPVSDNNGSFLSNYSWFIKLGHVGTPGIFYKDEIGNQANNFYVQQYFNVLPQANIWHQVILQKVSNDISIILDGINIGSIISYGSFNFGQSFLTKIGNTYTDYYNGQIDDMCVWNRAITPSEIIQLYTAAPTYLWSTGETTATINPSPTTTTTYWCDVTVNGVTCRKTMTITVNPNITPTFTQVAAICNGATLAALPTTSTNSITGTWSPALNNTSTTTYTFTPTSGQCATTATMTITVNSIPAAPTGALTQTFCVSPAPTIASLSATGTGIQWYAAATGGTALATTTALVNGTTYYATQTLNACESTTRLAVTVILNDPQITASATTVCSGTPVTIDISNVNSSRFNIIDFSNKFNYNPSNLPLGSTDFLSMPTGNIQFNNIPYSISSWNNTFNCWNAHYDTGNNPRILEFNFTSQVVNDLNLLANTFWGQYGPNSYVTIEFYNNSNLVHSKNLIGDIDIRDYNNSIHPNNINNTTTTNVFNFGNSRLDNIKIQLPSSQIINKVLVKDFGSTAFQRIFIVAATLTINANQATYLWSTGETTATINPTPTATTTYWCDVTVNGVTCRKSLTVTVRPPAIVTINSQLNSSICSNSTNVAVLGTSASNFLSTSWTTTTGTTILNPTTLVPRVTPSAQDIINNQILLTVTAQGSSPCPPVSRTLTIIVNTTPTPTGTASQTFCATPAPTVADLTATGTGIQWYAAANGGTALATTTALVNGTTYYASQTLNACESTTRLAVTVTLNDPQITASATTVCSGTPVTLSASTTATVAQNGNLPINLQTGLVGYWPFNGNANDLSGNGLNGTVNGATLTTDRFGNVNNAYSFNGVSSYINVLDNNQLDITGEMSLSCWFKKTQFQNKYEFMVGKEGAYNGNQCNYKFQFAQQDNNLSFYTDPRGFSSCSNSNNCLSLLNTTDWFNVIAVSKLNSIQLYLNGQLFYSSNSNNNSLLVTNNLDLMFGKAPFTDPNEPSNSSLHYKGLLDDIAIYNRALSPSEITQLYNSGQPTYLWSTGETTATINPMPTGTTTYWCDVTVNGVTCRKTMTITVNPNITPAFTQVAPICNGATLAALPTTSTNSITGTWSPALNNTATTTYTFTPTAGQCATTATMTITVNTTATPTGTASQTFCATPSPTVADLTVTGTGIQWYAAANGGTALATTTALVNGTTYYATQSLNACESTTRLAVTVTLNDPQITASATTVCSGTPVTLSASTTATVAQNGNLPTNLQTGLVGYWPFNGNANDVSGNANNGTVNGATLTTDRFGNANSAYDFDGQSYIRVPHTNMLNFGIGDYSLSVWANKSGNNWLHNLIAKATPHPATGWQLGFVYSDLRFLAGVQNSISLSNGGVSYGPIINGEWNNYIAVFNPTMNSIKIYKNGQIEVSTIVSSSLINCDNIYDLMFGVSNPNGAPSGPEFFQGKIDNIGIWNRALSQSEITQLYTSAPTYLWSTGETTATINPTPTTTTTYWCDVTVNGVTCRKTVTITVNPNIAPAFTQVAAICNGATLAALPTTSTNSITGTWSPALNNTATTTYTFTPTAGQCATTATMTITVNPNIAPTFTQVAPICNGATLAALPTTSNDGVTGTWSPALNNTATTTYTFTPTAGQCATTATMTITVNPNIAPIFTQVAAICNGATLAALPTTSTNSITGTWSPALDNTATTTYTFTPTVGLCATTATMTITVNPNITPAFSQVPAICNGATLAALPNTSFNNITGTWSPALNNTATTTYTFTPTAGQCATTATMTITVNPIITPAFTQVAAICSGADLSPLPTSSTNGINGTWSPALNYTATTTYTFTPIARQCATTATMTITVNPNIAPTFTQVTPICAGATLAALPTTSNNGYTGTWSPAMNNTATTTYTFTPTAGLCATTATMTITVNPLPLPPTGTITQTFCANIYPTLQNIVVTPANVNWFSSLTSSTPLPITTNLPVGSTTYYASQFDAVTGCSSNGRLAVLATVLLENTPSTLTDQTFCSTDLKTLADIKTNGLNIVWYSSASGGTPLLGSYVLTSSQSLYAAIYNATTGCESPIRQMVQITIINCQLVANNLLTLNDNSLNDNLKIENIENFPINQIEIYNRFGEIVWKTEYYNNDSNTFKGRANVSGVYQKDSDLPTGTYYFLLKYYDSYRGKYTDLKSFLYINNNN